MVTQRPLPVTLIAILSWAAAAMAGLVCFLLLVPGTRFDRIWRLNPAAQVAFTQHHPGRAAILLLMVGLIAVATGFGVLRGQRWAWILSIITFGVNAAGDVVSLVMTGDWVRSAAGILIDAVFLVLLLLPQVRAWFAPRS